MPQTHSRSRSSRRVHPYDSLWTGSPLKTVYRKVSRLSRLNPHVLVILERLIDAEIRRSRWRDRERSRLPAG